ncbi:MAG: hypothetical protein ACI4J1_10655 [Ruminiclostridium sp.]
MNLLINNLVLIAIACGFLAAAIIANSLFGMFYNVKKLQEQFQKEKLLDTAKQLAVFVVGLSLIAVIVTGFIPFLQFAGLPLDDANLEYISIAAILLIFAKSTISYTAQAIEKVNKIVGGKTNGRNSENS